MLEIDGPLEAGHLVNHDLGIRGDDRRADCAGIEPIRHGMLSAKPLQRRSALARVGKPNHGMPSVD